MARIAYPGLLAFAAVAMMAAPNDQGAAGGDPAAQPSPEEVTAQLLEAAATVEAANAAAKAAEDEAAKLREELEALKGGKAKGKGKAGAGDAFRVTVLSGLVHHPRAPKAFSGPGGVPFAEVGDDFTVKAEEVADFDSIKALGMVSVEAI